MIRAFLYRFSDSGFFFLDPIQFRRFAVLSLPFGDSRRPSPGLLSAVYLWGSLLCSNDRLPAYTEDDFLALTLHNVTHDLSMMHSSRIIIHTIQAEILLSLWYLHCGNPFAGRHHCAAAVSLATSAGLHNIVSVQQPPWPHSTLFSTCIYAPTNGIEARERIDAFWSVLVLDKLWVATSGFPSSVPFDSMVHISFSMDGSRTRLSTMTEFLDGVDLDSPFRLLAKAVILLEHSMTTDNIDPAGMPTINDWVESFRRSLPLLTGDYPLSPTNRQLLLIHCITNVALIWLHATPRIPYFQNSISRGFLAAEQVVYDLTLCNVSEWEYVDPILGPLISTVCNFYILNLSSFPNGSSSLQMLLHTLFRLSRLSPMMRHCYDTAQRHSAAVIPPSQ
ncbi:hypothetical protein C8R44DRAFT_984964 [Mycena epipterygia]|nr:hypothetical protein C8R44DRAFT_984964 [Mycena epipterygia]